MNSQVLTFGKGQITINILQGLVQDFREIYMLQMLALSLINYLALDKLKKKISLCFAFISCK